MSSDINPEPVDHELIESFRAALEKRKAARQKSAESPPQADGVVDVDSYSNLVDEEDSYSAESFGEEGIPAGAAYDFMQPEPALVGGYIPEESESYALAKVLEIRGIMTLSATVEPTEWSLEEFERIKIYNRELVETKRAERK